MAWDAEKYDIISSVQEKWGQRLLSSLSLRGDAVILDAGCGTGKFTGRLVERVPEGRVYGVDADTGMLEVARRRLEKKPVILLQSDLLDLSLPEPVDLIFSNSVFHWVLDQEKLYRKLFALLKPGGQLVVECGGKGGIFHYRDVAEEIRSIPEFSSWVKSLDEKIRLLDAKEGEELLRRAGFVGIRTSLTKETVVFESEDDFCSFTRTVILRPYLEDLPSDALKEKFFQKYMEKIRSPSGQYTLHFMRLNLYGLRPLDRLSDPC